MLSTSYNFSKKKFELSDVAIPQPGTGEVLVQIKATALCGTDLHIMDQELMDKLYSRERITLGHEWSGVVEKIGRGVKAFKAGDRIFGTPHIPCGICRNCRNGKENLCEKPSLFGMTRPGSHAEYLIAPQTAIIPLPEKLDFAIGALLSDTISTAYHAIKRTEITKQDKILILGAGPVGLTIGVLLDILGFRNISVLEKNPYRAKMANSLFGAKSAVGFKVLKRSIDVVYDTSGSEAALDIGFQSLVRGGKLILIGINDKRFSLDALRLMYREISIIGSYGYTKDEAKEFIDLTLKNNNHKKIEKVISHRFGLAQVSQAYGEFSRKSSGKIILSTEKPFDR